MLTKTVHISPNKLFRAVPTEQYGMFIIYNIATNLKVGILDAEEAKIKFTDDTSYISTALLIDIVNLANALQPSFI